MRPPALALIAVVTIPGCPPNLPNQRLHWAARSREIRMWRERANVLALEARNRAGWGPPVISDPPAPRFLEADIMKRLPHFDPDGAMAALKPLVDGIQGALLVKDSEDWCQWLRLPVQHRVERADDECVVLRVHLVAP